jgi:hypothetical protein
LHPLSELTYYDELGVASTAGPEEVRDSFRALVRIVHPDHQTDPQLKEIAEQQMRKLNRIYAVLSDPDKRRRYDEFLERDFGPTLVLTPGTNIDIRRLMGRMAWGAAALVILLVVAFWVATDTPGSPAAAKSERSPQPATQPATQQVARSFLPSEEMEQLREELRSTKLERDYAIRELQKLRGSAQRSAGAGAPEPALTGPPAVVSTLTELPSPQQPAFTPPSSSLPVHMQPQKASGPARVFSGFWFYSKEADQRGRAAALYPPEFIEATLTEQNGMVRGKYRSRYKIMDRAISPDVMFEFSGTANGNSLVAPWVGPGGSKGEISLKITGNHSLKVDWNTTEMGSIQALISGTATLTRRLD